MSARLQINRMSHQTNAVMDDMGCVLVITSPTHLSLVERVASRTGMVVGFHWALNSSKPYGNETRLGVSTKVVLPCAFMLMSIK